MNEQHPITPPDELVEQWRTQAPTARDAGATRERWIATQAARWGADQELEACCGFIGCEHSVAWSDKLRAAMRPKPPSLKAQALAALVPIERSADAPVTTCKKSLATIRRALEAMGDD